MTTPNTVNTIIQLLIQRVEIDRQLHVPHDSSLSTKIITKALQGDSK